MSDTAVHSSDLEKAHDVIRYLKEVGAWEEILRKSAKYKLLDHLVYHKAQISLIESKLQKL